MVGAQQPREPLDIRPIDGEVYYLINQHSGLQADSPVSSGSARVTQETWNFRESSQRWMLARAADGSWAIENVGTRKCLADGGPFYFNGGFPPDSIYIWNGLTLFNNADSSGSSNQADPDYSQLLSGIDALGGKLDQARKYKLVTSSGTLLSVAGRHVVFELDSWPRHHNSNGSSEVRAMASSRSVTRG